jgi:hypothetical protein
MGVPARSKGGRFQPELPALAKYPNVAVKATGQAGDPEDEYPFQSSGAIVIAGEVTIGDRCRGPISTRV